MIEMQNLWYAYPSGHTVLAGLNISIKRGEFVALIGQNGAGKTTFLKQLNGLLKPTSGVVKIAGMDTSRVKTAKLAQKVGFLFQNPDHQIFLPSVRQEIAFGPKNLGLPDEEVEARILQAAEAVGLTAVLDENPVFLSKGQRQRVAFASLLSMRPEILVLDEPTTGQDYRESIEIMEMVRELNEAGHTIIFVTHDMELVARYARRIILLRQGRVVVDGPVREVFYRPELLTATGLLPPQIVRLALMFGENSPLGRVLSGEEAYEAIVGWAGVAHDRCG